MDRFRFKAATPASGAGSATAAPAAEPACGLCRDAGWLRKPKPEGGSELVLCSCQHETARQRRLAELLALSGVEPAMSDMTFASFRPAGSPALAEALAAASEFAVNPDGWLVFHGTYGTGKTHLLAAIAQAVIAAGKPCFYQYAPKLLAQLRGTFRDDAELSYDALYKRIASADVLLLDDLGAEKSSEWALEQLTMMLDERYRAKAPTVIATNLDPETIGGRIGSRLRDVRLVTHVGMGTTDWRRKP